MYPNILRSNFTFQCSICEEATLYAQSLLFHLRQMHNITQTAKEVTEMLVKDEKEVRRVRAKMFLLILFYL